MKPFAGGRLLQYGRKVKIAKYQTGGATVDAKIPTSLTPVKCLSYVLSQPGICTTIVGVSNVNELRDILIYPKSSQYEKDYSGQLKALL